MVRKPQIFLRSIELLFHVLLAAIVTAILFFTAKIEFSPLFITPLALYPFIRVLFDEYTFIRLRSTVVRRALREFLYSAFALTPLITMTSMNQILLFSIILTFLTFALALLFPFIERALYARFPKSRIQLLFLGPAPIAEYFLSQVEIRNLSHLFNPVGYVDYKESESHLPFVGKFVQLESILFDIRPQVMINTGREEQHATISHTATVRGIQYFSFPQNIQWDTFELNHSGPFGLPLIEHTSSHLTYWAYALKRLLDISFSTFGLLFFFIPWVIKALISKAPSSEQVTCIDSRNGRQLSFTYKGTIPDNPNWRDFPLFVHILRNRLSLVGSRPTHAICEHHFDLKFGIFPLPASSSADPEVQTLNYIRTWSIWRELITICSGFWNIFISLFRS